MSQHKQEGVHDFIRVIAFVSEIRLVGGGDDPMVRQSFWNAGCKFGWKLEIDCYQLLTQACAAWDIASYRSQTDHQAAVPIRELLADPAVGSEQGQFVAQARY
jgi:hypothetical protein